MEIIPPARSDATALVDHGETTSAAGLEMRSTLARWLADVFAGPLTSFGPSIHQPPCDTASPARIPLLADAITALERAIEVSSPYPVELEAERVRLFVNAPGGIPAPPFGSWWMEGAINGESALRVAAFYLEECVEPGIGSGPADCLSTELEFIHFLLQHQRAARLTNRPDLERIASEREHLFVESLLCPWIGPFCAAGRGATSHAFWLAAFDLLQAFVRMERAAFDGSQEPR